MAAKALDLFVVAEQFRAAGKLVVLMPHLAETDPKYAFWRNQPNMPQPLGVCMAFALELYFKSLIRIADKLYNREHDLVSLFEMLEKKDQDEIKAYFQANSTEAVKYAERFYRETNRPVPRVDFDFVLNVSRKAFVKMRYLAEGATLDEEWLADDIVEGTRQVILRRHPDWEQARQVSHLPETFIPRSTFRNH